MLEPGTTVAGFRVERTLGTGSLGTVYEATQLSLGRTAALRLVGDADVPDPAGFERQQRRAASVHHPALVPIYEAGGWGRGRFVATRFVAGRTLEELLRSRASSRRLPPDLLDPIGAALAAAHAAGIVHGAVSTRNVIVDAAGGAYLADLGLLRGGTAAADRLALGELRALLERAARRRRARRASVAAVAAAAAAALVAAVVTADDQATRAEQAPAPAPAADATPLGSDLAPGRSGRLGCARHPGPNTPSCTFAHATLAGRAATAPGDGVIRSWAVRGASGELTLQVARVDDGRVAVTGFSQTVTVTDRGPHAFRANVPVRRGDVIGVLLGPGATVGTRAAGAGATVSRWPGGLPYRPEARAGTSVAGELLLRADVELGARPASTQVTGVRASALPAGVALAAGHVAEPAGASVRVEVVRVSGAVAVDASLGGRRLARTVLEGARPAGELMALEVECGFRHGFCVRWLNDGASVPVVHAYRLARGGRAFRTIG